MECHRMAQAMWSFVRYVKSTFLGPPHESSAYSTGLENATGSSKAKKDMSIVAMALYPLEIVIECRAHLINKRQFQWSSGLRLTNPNTLCSPFYIVKFEIRDITDT